MFFNRYDLHGSYTINFLNRTGKQMFRLKQFRRSISFKNFLFGF